MNICPSEYSPAPEQHWVTQEQVNNKDRKMT